jgi:hypothetical protein
MKVGGCEVQVRVATFVRALDAYAKWVGNLVRPGGSWGGDARIGYAYLQRVLEIRRTSFPHLASAATDLLVTHSEIANLIYAHELRAIHSSSTDRVQECDHGAQAATRQLVAIERLRRAVVPKGSIHARGSSWSPRR